MEAHKHRLVANDSVAGKTPSRRLRRVPSVFVLALAVAASTSTTQFHACCVRADNVVHACNAKVSSKTKLGNHRHGAAGSPASSSVPTSADLESMDAHARATGQVIERKSEVSVGAR